MIYICLYRPSGEVSMRTTVPDLATADRLSADLSLPYIVAGAVTASGYVKDGALIPFPPKSIPTAIWSWDTHTWEA